MFVLLHPLSRKKALKKKDWSGSSVWLEYMPVTHGVASSSLVRTAKRKEVLLAENFFFTPKATTFNHYIGAAWF